MRSKVSRRSLVKQTGSLIATTGQLANIKQNAQFDEEVPTVFPDVAQQLVEDGQSLVEQLAA